MWMTTKRQTNEFTGIFRLIEIQRMKNYSISTSRRDRNNSVFITEFRGTPILWMSYSFRKLSHHTRAIRSRLHSFPSNFINGSLPGDCETTFIYLKRERQPFRRFSINLIELKYFQDARLSLVCKFSSSFRSLHLSSLVFARLVHIKTVVHASNQKT